ncbi:hypothetical protein Ccrd_000401 [Cynara cardunculus var. scolymus]|uniref:Uncharacterized protein n=1 Tax=Cynara cardunculus var. scolymus TaxID=59895 RepID=A0A124SDN6_CYNCS|nr:hypothetical protein Ccrd_000401 [Cynara cardunculus var. scolymus]
MTLKTSKIASEAGGMANDPILVSIIIPCSTNNVDIWAKTAAKTIPVAQIGNIRIKIFSSSTCVTKEMKTKTSNIHLDECKEYVVVFFFWTPHDQATSQLDVVASDSSTKGPPEI